MPSVWPTAINPRPSASSQNGPPTPRHSTPPTIPRGAHASACRRCRWMTSPAGRSEIMRAKPNTPASRPSCQSASPAPRLISGSSGAKPPIENVFAPTITHSGTRSPRDDTGTNLTAASGRRAGEPALLRAGSARVDRGHGRRRGPGQLAVDDALELGHRLGADHHLAVDEECRGAGDAELGAGLDVGVDRRAVLVAVQALAEGRGVRAHRGRVLAKV